MDFGKLVKIVRIEIIYYFSRDYIPSILNKKNKPKESY